MPTLDSSVTTLVDVGSAGVFFVQAGRYVLLDPASGEEVDLGVADGARESQRRGSM